MWHYNYLRYRPICAPWRVKRLGGHDSGANMLAIWLLNRAVYLAKAKVAKAKTQANRAY